MEVITDYWIISTFSKSLNITYRSRHWGFSFCELASVGCPSNLPWPPSSSWASDFLLHKELLKMVKTRFVILICISCMHCSAFRKMRMETVLLPICGICFSPCNLNSSGSLSNNILTVFWFSAQSCFRPDLRKHQMFYIPVEKGMYSESLNAYSGQVLLWFYYKRGKSRAAVPAELFCVYLQRGMTLEA